MDLEIAVVIPCYNEAAAIADVIHDFSATLPEAVVYVYDNRSTDTTAQIAREAGAIVRSEVRRGKGNVVQRMFSDVEADIFVMVDGDGTYDASTSREMVDLLLAKHLDMVVGARVPIPGEGEVYRPGHTSGNLVFSKIVRVLFGGEFTDVFSGYRVMTRRFVKSLPVRSRGFEIETELSAHAARLRAASAEVATPYGSRRQDSVSKLRTYRDGMRILLTLFRLYEEMRPLQCFAALFALLTVIAVALGIPIVGEFARTGKVPRFPTAILAVSIQIVGFLSLCAGVILRSIGTLRDEGRRLTHLSVPAPWGERHGAGMPVRSAHQAR